MADDAEVVGDEQVGEAEVALEVREQVRRSAPGSRRRAPRRARRDHQLRLERQRPGDPDPLPLARPRTRAGSGFGARAASPTRSSSSSTRRSSSPPVGAAVQPQRVADDLRDPPARVERGERVLEDHLQLAAARAQVSRAEPDSSSPSKRTEPEVGCYELQHRAAEGRLAAAGLADEAERLAGGDREADAVDRPHPPDLAIDQHPGLDREVLDEVGTRAVALVESSSGRCAHRRASGEPSSLRMKPAAVVVTVPGAADLERRHLEAALERVRAALPEVAAGWRMQERGRLALDLRRRSPAGRSSSAPAGPWCRGAGVVEDLVEASLLDDRPAYMTATRSATSATTPRSWVISIIAIPSSPCRRFEERPGSAPGW